MYEAFLIADSGPLIALTRLGLLALPSRLFREALANATVWHEVTRKPHALELLALNAALQAGKMRVVTNLTALPPTACSRAARCR